VLPVPAPPVVGPLGVVVAGAEGVAEPDDAAPPVDADVDAPLELVVDVVGVVLVCVVLVLLVLFEAGRAVDVGTVNGGTSDVSAFVELPPQATRPTDSAAPLNRAIANFRMLVEGTIK
jgi:preprotein translocase subunit SecG